MLWDVAEPRNAGGLKRNVGIEATGDGAMNNGLLLFDEQRDYFLLRPNESVYPPVCVVEKPHDGGLLIGRGLGSLRTQ